MANWLGDCRHCYFPVTSNTIFSSKWKLCWNSRESAITWYSLAEFVYRENSSLCLSVVIAWSFSLFLIIRWRTFLYFCRTFRVLIKRGCLNHHYIPNYEGAYQLVFEYIKTFYNTVRIHSHCDYQSPNDYEKQYELQKISIWLVRNLDIVH